MIEELDRHFSNMAVAMDSLESEDINTAISQLKDHLDEIQSVEIKEEMRNSVKRHVDALVRLHNVISGNDTEFENYADFRDYVNNILLPWAA